MTARVHASGAALGLRETNGRTCTGREVQFLALAARGQEVTASGLEDGPGWDGPASGGAGRRGWRRMQRAFGRLPGYHTKLWNDGVVAVGREGHQLSRLFVGLIDQRKDASLGSKAEMIPRLPKEGFNSDPTCKGSGAAPGAWWRLPPSLGGGLLPPRPASMWAGPGQVGPSFRTKSPLAQPGAVKSPILTRAGPLFSWSLIR